MVILFTAVLVKLFFSMTSGVFWRFWHTGPVANSNNDTVNIQTGWCVHTYRRSPPKGSLPEPSKGSIMLLFVGNDTHCHCVTASLLLILTGLCHLQLQGRQAGRRGLCCAAAPCKTGKHNCICNDDCSQGAPLNVMIELTTSYSRSHTVHKQHQTISCSIMSFLCPFIMDLHT